MSSDPLDTGHFNHVYTVPAAYTRLRTPEEKTNAAAQALKNNCFP